MFGISYNTRYRNEVKIHDGSCRFTRNSSQAGEVKWKYGEDLGKSVLIANDLCSDRNRWRYAQCCMRNESYVYKCRQCNKLTKGKRQVKKIGFLILSLIGILPYFGIYGINLLLPEIKIYSYYHIAFLLLFLATILGMPVYYYTHKKKCSNCKTDKYA